MPLKKTKEGVVLVPGKKPKIGVKAPQYNLNCWDMAKVQSALLAKPPVPFWKREII